MDTLNCQGKHLLEVYFIPIYVLIMINRQTKSQAVIRNFVRKTRIKFETH